LGGLSDVQTETAFREFYKAASDLLDEWVQFYRNYNNPSLPTRLTANAYDTTIDSLRALADQQNAVALERSTVIDNTIQLTDRVTVIAFVSSITITLVLILTLIRTTNASLFRLRVGVERFGAGDLTHRIVMRANLLILLKHSMRCRPRSRPPRPTLMKLVLMQRQLMRRRACSSPTSRMNYGHR